MRTRLTERGIDVMVYLSSETKEWILELRKEQHKTGFYHNMLTFTDNYI